MKLLTKELEQRFAQVGSQEETDLADQIIIAKFFNPNGGQTWLATEYNPADRMFFGYVSLFNERGMNEYGYFSLDELEGVRGAYGLPLERDIYWTECTMAEAKRKEGIA